MFLTPRRWRRLVANGATFRVCAPGAEHVYVALGGADDYTPRAEDELVKHARTGHWTGFFPQVSDGTKYRFKVAGPGGSGLRRDPRARELELFEYPPRCDSILRPVDSYPWHDHGYRPPAFSDLIVYQFHVGSSPPGTTPAVTYAPTGWLSSWMHWNALNTWRIWGLRRCSPCPWLQPLPLVEFQGEWSLGYNGTDIYSPEMDDCVAPADWPLLGPA